MARVAGKDGSVELDDVEVVGVTSWECTGEADILDSTGMDSGGTRTKIAGLLNWTGTVVGVWDGAEAEIRTGGKLTPGTTITKIEFIMSNGQTYSGSCVVKNFRPTSPVEGLVGWTAELEGSGALAYPGAP
jgi:hypothetical protein